VKIRLRTSTGHSGTLRSQVFAFIPSTKTMHRSANRCRLRSRRHATSLPSPCPNNQAENGSGNHCGDQKQNRQPLEPRHDNHPPEEPSGDRSQENRFDPRGRTVAASHQRRVCAAPGSFADAVDRVASVDVDDAAHVSRVAGRTDNSDSMAPVGALSALPPCHFLGRRGIKEPSEARHSSAMIHGSEEDAP
jgi:hypothetical protein